MSKVCSACGATVERNRCHKNRLGEYVCWKCQAARTELPWHLRLRYLTRGMLPGFLMLLPVAVMVLLMMWVFAKLLLSVDLF